MDDGRACVLTEWQDATGSHLGIAQELQGYILIVLTGFRIIQDLSHLKVMLAAQHELHIVESLLGKKRQSLFRHLYDLLAFKLSGGYAVLRQKAILCLVFAHLKHRGILEIYVFSHNCICLMNDYINIRKSLLSSVS